MIHIRGCGKTKLIEDFISYYESKLNQILQLIMKMLNKFYLEQLDSKEQKNVKGGSSSGGGGISHSATASATLSYSSNSEWDKEIEVESEIEY